MYQQETLRYTMQHYVYGNQMAVPLLSTGTVFSQRMPVFYRNMLIWVYILVDFIEANAHITLLNMIMYKVLSSKHSHVELCGFTLQEVNAFNRLRLNGPLILMNFAFYLGNLGNISRHQTARYFCSLGPHLENTIKMFTYDDQTSQGVSTTPVLRVYTCHMIHK